MIPRKINQLPQSLVNRIAAGEVIERPASVVKELVENALDAGARSIEVDVQDGGRELIRVIDDGHGIPAAELALAFASHATSKLLTDEDLFNIATMGFRGEALASIGSVSHARIVTRTADSEVAHEIVNKGGALTDIQSAAGNRGTTIEVRNLFFNVPARRKFLKGAPTEFGHIQETLLRTALPHPQVTFRLSHNGRVVMELPATSPEQRLLEVWPGDFRDRRLQVDARDAEIRVRGIVGLPELARLMTKYQVLYVNQRPIRDKYIQHALREAFRGLTEPGRHPAAVLMIDVPPADVDVNVHPTKSEVRFRDSGRIHGLVLSAVRERLLSSDLTPRAEPRGDSPDERRRQLQQQLAHFFKSAPAPAPPGAAGSQQVDTAVTGHAPGIPDVATTPGIPSTPGDPVPAFERDQIFLRGAPPVTPVFPEIDQARNANYPPADRAVAHDALSERSAPADPAMLGRRSGSAIQLHNSYLVAESEDGMVIIDQHALHERIMFEDLLARIQRGPLESQRLLIPITLPAGSRQIAMFEQIGPLLEKLGIDVQPFGPDSVAIHAFPSFLHRLDPGAYVQDLMDKSETELLNLTPEQALHELLDMMACKAAVKAGDPLTTAEIEALLARRELVERSSNCPHGRPTTLRLTLRDLEKQFKRTGFGR